jgi:uncharacterized protein
MILSPKPLIIRGARQTGKTFIVREFAKENYKYFFQLNLEKEEHKRLFENDTDAKKQLRILETYFAQKIVDHESLIFIDEIQNSKSAIQMLRYFFEELPNLHIIAAGSLLEIMLKELDLSFPVGRVQYLYMHPVTFDEYLKTFEEKIYQELSNIDTDSKIEEIQHRIYLEKVQEYALIGEMPEMLTTYLSRKSLVDAESVYESLTQSFFDDISKYSNGESAKYIRHVLYTLPANIGQEIIYKGFGGSAYGSREMSQAFETLELVGLLSRVISARSVALPLVSNFRKRTKLIYLDIGLANFALKQKQPFFFGLSKTALENVYKGGIAEQFVGQSLISCGIENNKKPHYWYRDKAGSTAEVDFLVAANNQLIPLEVKNSNEKLMRSLQLFIDESYINKSSCRLAIRAGVKPLALEMQLTREGNRYNLMHLPFYLFWRLENLVSNQLNFT